MYIMKKIFLILICITLLASCSDASQESAEQPAGQTTQTTEFTYDFEKLEQSLKELTYQDINDEEQKLFGEGSKVDEEYVSKYMLFDVSVAEELFVMRHDDEAKATLLMMIKPANGIDDAARGAFNEFLKLYGTQFDGYFPEEYDLMMDYYTVDKGDYIVYIISYDNGAVLNAINKAKVQK